MARIRLGSAPYAAGSPAAPIPLTALPVKEPGGISYLARIIVDVNITAVTTGAGGACTPLEFHNLISQLTVNDGTSPWGPDRLSGEHLAGHDMLIGGEPVPFATDANGDANLALSQTNATRRFTAVFDYSDYGEQVDDCTPPASALRNGQVLIQFSALPTNVTALTATITVYAETFPLPKVRAVPRLRVFPANLNSLDFSLPVSGFLAFLALRKSSNWAAGDITSVDLVQGSLPILRGNDVMNLFPEWNWINPEVTSQRVQRHFAEGVGGTTPRILPIYPLRLRQSFGMMPSGDNFVMNLQGAVTAAALTAIIGVITPNKPADTVNQWAGCGCERSDLEKALIERPHEVLQNDTANKVTLERSRIMGVVPQTLKDPALLAKLNVMEM